MTKIEKKTEKSIKDKDVFSIPDCIVPIDKRLFYPDWFNQPPYQPPILKLAGINILSAGNSMSVVSKAGIGKSSICEAIISKHLNPNCDGLGFTVSLQLGREKILYMDTERSLQDSWKSWERIYIRAGIKKPEIDERIIVVNVKMVAVAERKLYVEKILKNNRDVGLVMLDGAGHFIEDTNSLTEAVSFTNWKNTFNPNIAIFKTMHTNPNDDKPRGHAGSEFIRDDESTLLLRRLINDDTREITSNFIHGKVRNDNDDFSTYYQWSDKHEMFVSVPDYQPKNKKGQGKDQKYFIIAQEIFNGNSMLPFSTIVKGISEKTGKVYETSKQIFFRHFQDKLIVKSDEGKWKIIGTNMGTNMGTNQVQKVQGTGTTDYVIGGVPYPKL
jgi:hypothetical protein